MTADSPTASARGRFPRGLSQPPGSFRFSVDALLLAAFALRFRPAHAARDAILDLGCGCGVAGLACLLGDAGASCLGVDIAPELTAAAAANAAALGLADRFTARTADLAQAGHRDGLPENAFTLAIANMPFRPAGSGRLPRSALREKALFADERTMPAFMKSAWRGLAPSGSFFLVYPWDTREALFGALAGQGFSLDVTLPVCTVRGTPSRCLVRAVQGATGKDARHEPPLVLHERGEKHYTDHAADFCPWLVSRPWSAEE